MAGRKYGICRVLGTSCVLIPMVYRVLRNVSSTGNGSILGTPVCY